jgi:transposase-like protein
MAYNQDTASFEKMPPRFVSEPDPMLSMLEWLCHKLMEVEVDTKVGASKGEHANGRSGYRSGTRVRRFDTRMGTMYLLVPKVRKGGYVPFFVTEKKRSEQALLQVVQEAFVNGISTRKIERLAKSLGIESISASQVSEINKELKEQVAEFRQRRLESTCPVIWIDALYEKTRIGRGSVIWQYMLSVELGLKANVRSSLLNRCMKSLERPTRPYLTT